MPPPARRRLLRVGAGASPGLHGLALGSSARSSAKATPGKGTLPPLLCSLRPGHLHPVEHSRRVRCPLDPIVPAPHCSYCPAAVLPPTHTHANTPPSQRPSWGREWSGWVVGLQLITFSGKGGGIRESGRAGAPGRGTPRYPEPARPGLPGRWPQLEISYWEEVPEIKGIRECPHDGAQLSAFGVRVG